MNEIVNINFHAFSYSFVKRKKKDHYSGKWEIFSKTEGMAKTRQIIARQKVKRKTNEKSTVCDREMNWVVRPLK